MNNMFPNFGPTPQLGFSGLSPVTAYSLSFGSTVPVTAGVATPTATKPKSTVAPAPAAEPVNPSTPNVSFWDSFKRPDDMGGGYDFGAIASLTESLGDLANIYSSFRANRIARDTLDFQRDSFQKNFANQVSTFNMNLEDRAHNRARQAGQTTAEAEAYINKHRLGA